MTLNEAIDLLAAAGISSASYDAREIFRYYGGLSPVELVSRNAQSSSPQVLDAIARRAAREPLQYIIGECDFYRERYFVSPDCLIPRSDTEVLVDYAVKNLPAGASFLDLCTGSGCVGVSVLNNTDSTEAVAVDISSAALEIARRNAERNGVSARLALRRCDVMNQRAQGEFFAVLSNPPYVSKSDYQGLAPEIYHEPEEAFLGGEDGGDFYRAITPMYLDVPERGGFIAYEIGYDQADMLKGIANEHGLSCEIIKDLSGNDRVGVLRKA